MSVVVQAYMCVCLVVGRTSASSCGRPSGEGAAAAELRECYDVTTAPDVTRACDRETGQNGERSSSRRRQWGARSSSSWKIR